MWLVEALDTSPLMPVCLHWHPLAKTVLAGPTVQLARSAGRTAELATPGVTYYQKSKDRQAHQATVLQALVLSHLKRSQLDLR